MDKVVSDLATAVSAVADDMTIKLGDDLSRG